MPIKTEVQFFAKIKSVLFFADKMVNHKRKGMVIKMTKSILNKNFILSSYAVIALVTLSFAAALFENSYEQYIYILIPDIILSEAAVFACNICKADLKITFYFLIIHHIGIVIHETAEKFV